MMHNTRVYGALTIGIFAMVFTFFISTANASASSPITDIKDGVNDVLFGGDNQYAAGVILTATVMMAAGLVLGVLRLPPAGIFIVLFCILGGLTAIGWADVTFILVAGLIAAALFTKTAVNYVAGGGGGDEAQYE